MDRRIEPLQRLVADQLVSRDVEAKTWQKGVAINGLLSIGETETARAWIDRSIQTQTSNGYLSYGDYDVKTSIQSNEWPDYSSSQFQCGAATIGQSVLEMYERHDSERYSDAARTQYEAVLSAARTDGGGIQYTSGLPELWVDSMYMVPPFLAKYGTTFGDDEAIDEAVTQLSVHHERLFAADKGLYRHIWREVPDTYPDSSLWSRGNGWALAGIVDTMEQVADGADRDELERRFVELCETIASYQDDSGFWHHILDDPRSSLETSGTLMFLYAISRGIAAGLLDEAHYSQTVRDALEACVGVVDEEGDVRRVALPPGGPGVSLGDTSYGQGWFLLATSAVPDRYVSER